MSQCERTGWGYGRGMTSLRVWAPKAERVEAVLEGDDRRELTAGAGGWWSLDADLEAGSSYAFSLDGGNPLPDPRSLRQPAGVHEASAVYDHETFTWTDGHWRGLHLPSAVIYELHVGTFTPEGTLDAAIGKLDHLVELGITGIELLPVNGFNGEHGWGYDGVALFAVHEPYGGPDALKRFVDAAHAKGLGVVIDAVYNHLGPSGNYLPEFGPYFTDRHSTPWGSAVNLDAPGSTEVRRFIIDNAAGWLRDFHADGLRLDAVHELADHSAIHILEQLALEVRGLGAKVGRPLFLIAESDLNDPVMVRPREAGGRGLDAQWSDDIHHSLHATLTGERQGYYGDFGSLPTLAKALTGAFVHDGAWSSFRDRIHGRPVDRERTPGYRFVGYLQDHDQIGNRATGDRIGATVSAGLIEIGAALVLCSPFTPMLFMGEEWNASTPWQFFTSHPEPDLAEAVRNGRRSEFASHGWDSADVPDPQDPATFEASKLDWAEPAKDEHARVLAWYRTLIALRRAEPTLTEGRLDATGATYDEAARWFVLTRSGVGGTVAVVANLSADPLVVPLAGNPTEVLAASRPGFTFRAGEIELAAESVAVVRVLAT